MCYVCVGTQKLELQEVVSCLTECWDLNSFLEEQDMCCLSSHAKKKKKKNPFQNHHQSQ